MTWKNVIKAPEEEDCCENNKKKLTEWLDEHIDKWETESIHDKKPTRLGGNRMRNNLITWKKGISTGLCEEVLGRTEAYLLRPILNNPNNLWDIDSLKDIIDNWEECKG